MKQEKGRKRASEGLDAVGGWSSPTGEKRSGRRNSFRHNIEYSKGRKIMLKLS